MPCRSHWQATHPWSAHRAFAVFHHKRPAAQSMPTCRIVVSWFSSLGCANTGLSGLSGTISGAPTPDFSALAALEYAVAHDVSHHIAVTGKQRFGRAHFSADRQLALGQAVAAIFLKLGLAAVGLGAAGTESALVHLAAHAKSTLRRKLGRAKRAGVGAVAAADADILVVQ